MKLPTRPLLALPALLLASLTALAQTVQLTGTMGNKALLIVDGSAPKSLSPGQTHQGVRLISTSGDEAVLEIAGKRQTLRVGESPASVAGSAPSGGGRIVFNPAPGGHYTIGGKINGRAVEFLVDTGASAVVLGATEAEQVGLNYRTGRPVQIATANGVTQAWSLKIGTIRLGDVELHEVDAIVAPLPLPYVLLGNSFLSRFQMKSENGQMTLERRY